MPSDEAIEYVLLYYGYEHTTVADVRRHPKVYVYLLEIARLIQQYEPDRLRPAVDVAAEEYEAGQLEYPGIKQAEIAAFKAGAAWQKENGNV